MKKTICLMLILTILCGIAAPAFAEKEVLEGYTPIRTAQELDSIRNNLSGKYILMNDIDLGEYENWVPIGTKKQPFSGIFDGNNHSIKNLNINCFVKDLSRSSSGFFAFVRDSEIKNTNIDSDISITAEAKAFYCSGLLVGNADFSKIINCSSSGSVNLNLNGTCMAGGIAGEVGRGSIISHCKNTAAIFINAVTELETGGVCGSSNSPIICCSNEGYLSIVSDSSNPQNESLIFAGGICGSMFMANISDSYNSGSINCEKTASNLALGGICGRSFSVERCFNVGTINAITDNYIGGISGKVISETDAESIYKVIDTSIIQDCFCINSFNEIVGNGTHIEIKNSKIKTDSELKQKKTFNKYDFEYIWEMNDGNYPVLKEYKDKSIVNAEIVSIPLKNRFVINNKINIDGIKIKFFYDDNSTAEYVAKNTGDGYGYINSEIIQYHSEKETLFGFSNAIINIGNKCEIKYLYFSFPSFFGFDI